MQDAEVERRFESSHDILIFLQCNRLNDLIWILGKSQYYFSFEHQGEQGHEKRH
jgi:hypothetical protein